MSSGSCSQMTTSCKSALGIYILKFFIVHWKYDMILIFIVFNGIVRSKESWRYLKNL